MCRKYSKIAQMDTKNWWYFGRCISGFNSCLVLLGLEPLHFAVIIGMFTTKLNMVVLLPKFLKHQQYTPEVEDFWEVMKYKGPGQKNQPR